MQTNASTKRVLKSDHAWRWGDWSRPRRHQDLEQKTAPTRTGVPVVEILVGS